MTKKLTEVLFPATADTHRRFKAGEFSESINRYAQGCEGCKRFATAMRYAPAVAIDALIYTTIVFGSSFVYQAITHSHAKSECKVG